ncbi:hypothetical protein [Streptosporangium subroseum]|uniref:hypothetical protein n=1 Tax=Streptosporangium subroseum TaxID=106412 RepID=UPI00308F920C|nr:hypothetical protein OHB15_50405 [Streptosporangium subroseum]
MPTFELLLTALQLATAGIGLYGGVVTARRGRTGSRHVDDHIAAKPEPTTQRSTRRSPGEDR